MISDCLFLQNCQPVSVTLSVIFVTLSSLCVMQSLSHLCETLLHSLSEPGEEDVQAELLQFVHRTHEVGRRADQGTATYAVYHVSSRAVSEGNVKGLRYSRKLAAIERENGDELVEQDGIVFACQRLLHAHLQTTRFVCSVWRRFTLNVLASCDDSSPSTRCSCSAATTHQHEDYGRSGQLTASFTLGEQCTQHLCLLSDALEDLGAIRQFTITRYRTHASMSPV